MSNVLLVMTMVLGFALLTWRALAHVERYERKKKAAKRGAFDPPGAPLEPPPPEPPPRRAVKVTGNNEWLVWHVVMDDGAEYRTFRTALRRYPSGEAVRRGEVQEVMEAAMEVVARRQFATEDAAREKEGRSAEAGRVTSKNFRIAAQEAIEQYATKDGMLLDSMYWRAVVDEYEKALAAATKEPS